MKKIRFLLILLCLCLILPILVACGNDEEPVDTETKYKYDDLTRETAADSIPDDYDLEAQTITILYTNSEKYTLGDDEATDIVYSKIHERNEVVAERLNVDIEFFFSGTNGWQEASDFLKREIATMSSGFECVFTTNNAVILTKMFNYFHNVNDSEYIDSGERWWYEDAIMEMSVDDNNYRFLYGDIFIDDLGKGGAIFYNKSLYEQYLSANKNPDELYQIVLDGKWVFEEFTRLVKKSHIEKGGDGSTDIYGFTVTHREYAHYLREGVGIRIYERNEQGMPVFDFKDDKSVDFANALYALFYNNEGVLNNRYLGHTIPDNFSFTNSNTIFNLDTLSAVLSDNMREMKEDFGILPYPKWDEEQEEYITLVHNSCSTVCFPISADIDRVNEEVSAVVEALASESYRRVSVPFYEAALKSAYNRDLQSAQMIDIITGSHETVKSKITKNFAFEYSSSMGSIGYIFEYLIYENNPNFVSRYDSMIDPANTGLKELLKQYKDGTL
ncbi:MAG: hypothetical protein IJD67_02320 [Clostridia bacterium]|nr:hypothetical protein [Clostridia bacterium]